jgi:hypothetical protein
MDALSGLSGLGGGSPLGQAGILQPPSLEELLKKLGIGGDQAGGGQCNCGGNCGGQSGCSCGCAQRSAGLGF